MRVLDYDRLRGHTDVSLMVAQDHLDALLEPQFDTGLVPGSADYWELFDTMLPTLAAAQRLNQIGITAPPLEYSPAWSDLAGNAVMVKRADKTDVGSFKVYGPANFAVRLGYKRLQRGLITVSAGNHAQGVAMMAQHFDTSATVVMPENTSRAKRDAVAKLGAKVVLMGLDYSEATSMARRAFAATTATWVPAYDHPDIIAGNSVLALEALWQYRHFDYAAMPVGGGGLALGMGKVLKTLRPDITTIGVQHDGCNPIAASFGKKLVPNESVNTFSEGTAVRQPSPAMFRDLHGVIDRMVSVDSASVAMAFHHFRQETGTALEVAGVLAATGMIQVLKESGIRNKQALVVASGKRIDRTMINKIEQLYQEQAA